MVKKTIYLFRHGETDWNVEGRFQGHTNIPLNENGRKQALELKELIRPLKPELILSSDLSRALETARIISGDQIPLLVSSELREAKLGEPEGCLVQDIITKFGEEAWKKWRSVDPADMDFAFPGGETKRNQLMRAKNFIEKSLREKSDAQRIAVSTHGGTLRRLLHDSLNSPHEQMALPNCCLFEMTFDPATSEWEYKNMLSSTQRPEKMFT